MNVAGILNSNPFNLSTPTVNTPQSSFQKEFQQLGQDLQSGNLSAAQSDFAALQQNAPPGSHSLVTQEFSQLGKDLQSGNLPAAQQDFSSIQQGGKNPSTSPHSHHHHHSGAGAGWSTAQSTLAQEFATLGQSLQSGNISAAQQAYSAVQQSFPAFTPTGGSAPVQVNA